VAVLISKASAICSSVQVSVFVSDLSEQDTPVKQLSSVSLADADKFLQMLSLLMGEADDVLLGHKNLRRLYPMREDTYAHPTINQTVTED